MLGSVRSEEMDVHSGREWTQWDKVWEVCCCACSRLLQEPLVRQHNGPRPPQTLP